MKFKIDKRLAFADHAKIKKADGDNRWHTQPSKVTKQELEQHFNNGTKYGVPFLKQGGDCVITAMIDMDDHNGSVGWDGMVNDAQAICEKLSAHGLEANPYRSGGGHGINLWLAWKVPQDAHSVRQKLQKLMLDLGYTVGDGGVSKHQVEIFPKQDRIGFDETGNCAAIPRLPLDPLFLENSDFYDWIDSKDVPYIKQAVVPEAEQAHRTVQTVSHHQLTQLLDAIPNVGDSLDYDSWWTIISAIHHAGGTLAMAEAWSAKSDKYIDGYLARKWKSLKKSRGRVVTVNTLIRMARDHGWEGFGADLDAFPKAPDDEIKYDLVGGKGVKGHLIRSTIGQVSKCVMVDDIYPWKYSHDRFFGQMLVNDDRLSDAHYVESRCWFEHRHWDAVSKEMVRDVIHAASNKNESDLALNWVEGLSWDGVDRLPKLIISMGFDDTEYAKAVVTYLLTALIGRQYEPGAQCDMIPILVGEQGFKKSTIAMALAPNILGNITSGEATLGQLIDGENAARLVKGKTVLVLDELRGMRRNRDAIKNALTRRWEEHTPKYVEHREQYARRCVLIGTTNESEFLDDPTGARRYLPIRVGKQVDVSWVQNNLNDLWAQAKTIYKAKGICWQDAERLAKYEHEGYEIGHQWEELLDVYLEKEHEPLSLDAILENEFQILPKDRTQKHREDLAALLRKKGWAPKRQMINGIRRKFWTKKTDRIST